MPPEPTLEEITALVLEEFEDRGGERLSPTAYNKILHFVEKQLDDRGIDADVPMFWYMFGRVATTNTNPHVSIENTGEGQKVMCAVSPSSVNLSERSQRAVQNGIDEGLNLYFESDLDGLIRASYDDAPYEAQRVFLDLKDQLESEADQSQRTLGDFSANNDQIRSLVYEFIREFPTDEFPEYERDLNKWYRILGAELDSDDPDFEYVYRLTKRFWQLFCLELACRENTGLDPNTIANELSSVQMSIDQTKEELRDWLHREEKEFTRSAARDSDAARKAAEVIVAPQLNVEISS